MRARIKKRQMYRRATIIAVVVGVLLVLIVGFYFAFNLSHQFDKYIGQPVSSADMSTLQQLSSTYGPSDSTLISQVKTYSGTPYVSNGKPVVVYIGADYCMYCAAQRWPLVMALMRFGTIANLTYMASGASEGNYATLSFHGSKYTSNYLVFQGFENRDRSNQPLDALPTNYTGPFGQYGSAYPFINLGNKYIVAGAIVDPSSLAGKDYQGVFNDVRSNSTLGTHIREAANLFTALICKLTSGQPVSVCSQPSISGLTISIASYTPASLGAIQNGSYAAPMSQWTDPTRSEQHK